MNTRMSDFQKLLLFAFVFVFLCGVATVLLHTYDKQGVRDLWHINVIDTNRHTTNDIVVYLQEDGHVMWRKENK